jgi:hypothetical protein
VLDVNRPPLFDSKEKLFKGLASGYRVGWHT